MAMSCSLISRSLARIRFATDVLGNLRDTVDTTGFVKVTRTVEQRQLDTRHLRKTFIALHLIESSWQVDVFKGSGRLIKELEAVPADLKVAQLFGDDDLEDHRRLM